MKKIIVSILIMGLLLTCSIANVNAFEKEELPEQPEELPGQSQPIKVIPYANIYVDDDNTQGPQNGTYEHPFQHIQDGINEAEDGDIVYVFSGIYNENVIVDKAITLRGEDRNTTIIDGGGKGDSINITADHVCVSDFTIRSSGFRLFFAGVSIFSSNNNTIKDNIIAGNKPGVYLRYSCKNNIISGNNITENYIGVLLRFECSNNHIIDNKITKNYMGIDFDSWNVNNYIISNSIKNNSYGIFCVNHDYGFNTIRDNTISGSSGCAIQYESDNNIITNNVLVDNSGSIESLTGGNNIISDNLITNDTFAAVDLEGWNNIISGNTIIGSKFIGIRIVGGDNNIISGNNIINSHYAGIELTLSDSCELIGNNIILGTYDSPFGIEVFFSNYNIIIGNTIEGNSIPPIYKGNGLWLWFSYNNTIGGATDDLKNDIKSFEIGIKFENCRYSICQLKRDNKFSNNFINVWGSLVNEEIQQQYQQQSQPISQSISKTTTQQSVPTSITTSTSTSSATTTTVASTTTTSR